MRRQEGGEGQGEEGKGRRAEEGDRRDQREGETGKFRSRMSDENDFRFIEFSNN